MRLSNTFEAHLNRLYLVIMVFFAVSTSAFAGGLSAWQEDTPYGHSIYHDGTSGGWIEMRIDTINIEFQHFYFYKGFTVAESDSSYFIIDEKNEQVEKFTDKAMWQRAIANKKLEPTFKRTYSSAYGVDKEWDPLLLFLLPIPLLLPILWLFCLISLFLPWKRAKGFRKYFVWIYPSLLLVVWLWYAIPQSF